jgi:hypothetical protein
MTSIGPSNNAFDTPKDVRTLDRNLKNGSHVLFIKSISA